MLYIAIDTGDALRMAFEKAGRRNSFSYRAYDELADYYNDIVDEIVELDVIEVCGDWTEYTEKELTEQYSYMDEDFDSMLEKLDDIAMVLSVKQSDDSYTYLVMEFN